PQAVAEHFHELGPYVRVAIEEREDFAPIENCQAAHRHRPGVSCALFPIEQRDLAEDLLGLKNRQHDFLTVRRRHADSHAPAENRHHAVTGGPHQKNRLAGGVAANANASEQNTALLGVKLAKQKALAEHSASLFGRRATCHSHHGSASGTVIREHGTHLLRQYKGNGNLTSSGVRRRKATSWMTRVCHVLHLRVRRAAVGAVRRRDAAERLFCWRVGARSLHLSIAVSYIATYASGAIDARDAARQPFAREFMI